MRTLCNADKRFGIDLRLQRFAGRAVDAAEEQFEHIANVVSQRWVAAPPTREGDSGTRKHHSAAGGVALALALALMGCSDDGTGSSAEDTSGATPTKTSTSASPTTTPKTPEERATGQLVKYLKARDDALQSLRFVGKRFEGVAAGQEFLTLQQRIIEYSSNKFTLSGEYVHTLSEPRQRSDSTVLVEVCEDESSVDFVTEAGTPVDAESRWSADSDG